MREGVGGSGRGKRVKLQDGGGFGVLTGLGEEATGVGEEGEMGKGAGLTLQGSPCRERACRGENGGRRPARRALPRILGDLRDVNCGKLMWQEQGRE